MTAQHVFRPKPSRQITTTPATKPGACSSLCFYPLSKVLQPESSYRNRHLVSRLEHWSRKSHHFNHLRVKVHVGQIPLWRSATPISGSGQCYWSDCECSQSSSWTESSQWAHIVTLIPWFIGEDIEKLMQRESE